MPSSANDAWNVGSSQQSAEAPAKYESPALEREDGPGQASLQWPITYNGCYYSSYDIVYDADTSRASTRPASSLAVAVTSREARLARADPLVRGEDCEERSVCEDAPPAWCESLVRSDPLGNTDMTHSPRTHGATD